ncbi:N-acetyldiaminopimelate deacetylase [Bacillus massilinigeriensis]|uniref:N-acetyldiaminopimelate deacetylase n=1 Tax=Bacillus mediterraneensis TaxID=1805474 RepID=UPI0008F94482|nr:N-acetyldiaminopimelate deacetylase [Bacillus mediterraneensis]
MEIQHLIKVRRELHQIPELGFQEIKTQNYLLTFLKGLNQERLEIKLWKTGVFVKINGLSPSKTIGYRADMDGLPIEEETGLVFRSVHEGRMHACGHDFHMTIALGLIEHFIQEPVNDNLLFIFQPAEEGPGGALPMMNSQIMKEWKPDMIMALHIAPEYPAGTVATKEGMLFANTSELFINLKGKGGHAARPHQANDMIIAACMLVTQLQTIISRSVDPLDSAVITVGKLTAGTVQNIIAESSRIEGTIRTFSADSMAMVKKRLEAIVKGVEAAYECKAEIDYGAMYHQVYNDHTLTREFINFAKSLHNMKLIECNAAMTGEDFGYMLKEIPGFMLWLGVGSEYGLHHAKLNPDESAIDTGVRLLKAFIRHKSC